ncbi:disulfide bond formation protein B [Streptomyces sp. 8N706]|uniref:disulfide bond formation protein B n=1 Tax=Streptomyces sp. 8N706 TaxID=3457416 RepID=UPI003FD36EAD
MTTLRFTGPGPSVSRLTNLWGLWYAHLYVLALTAVLAGGFVIQFGQNALPCALCVVQRAFMVLAALGPASLVAISRHRPVTTGDFATGWGMSVLASVCGAAASGRQILQYIKPGVPGYGSTVLGLHLYTWTFITFVIAVVAAAAALFLADEAEPLDNRSPVLSFVTLGFLGLVIAANLVSVLALEGLHPFLPDSPDHYRLLRDLGIR